MKSTSIAVRFSMLAVLALVGVFTIFIVRRHEGSVRPMVHPRDTVTLAEDCKDHVIHGLHCGSFPNICSDPMGREVCQSTCNVCGTTTAASGFECKDHVKDGLTCAQVKNFCNDTYAIQLCPRFCGFCNSTSTQPSQQQTTTQGASSASTQAPLNTACADYVGNGYLCGYVPGICADLYGKLLCKRHCNLCVPQPGEPTIPPNTVPPGTCVDHVIGDFQCSQLPGVCKDSAASRFCPQHCGSCSSTTTTEEPCMDHLVHGQVCGHIPGICGLEYGRVACRRHCRYCTGPTSQAHHVGYTPSPDECVDNVGYGLRCRDLHQVCNDSSPIGPMILCRKYCGKCPPPASTAATAAAATTPAAKVTTAQITTAKVTTAQITTAKVTTAKVTTHAAHTITAPATKPTVSAATSPVCQDNVGNGRSCSTYVNICSSPYAAELCPSYCNLCGQTTAHGHLGHQTTAHHGGSGHQTTAASTTDTCKDNVGNGMDCQQLKDNGFCQDPYSRVLCRKTCSHCSECKDQVLSCEILHQNFPDLCNDHYSQMTCLKYCGFCSSMTDTTKNTTPPTPPTTTPSGSSCKSRFNHSSCQDDAEIEVCRIQEFCTNPIAQVVCRRTCQFCEDGCADRLQGSVKCADLYGPGKAVPDKTALCNDPLGIQACEATCGCPGFCPLNHSP